MHTALIIRPILLASLCLIASLSFANTIRVRGTVTDIDTKERIPFAHVVVGDVITLTNLDGEFVVETASDTAQTLMISVMGYETATRRVSEEYHYFDIFLAPSVLQLEEVQVMTGDDLMRDVFNRFHINYEMTRHRMIGYYKENLYTNKSMNYLAEGIVDIYVPPNINFNQTLVSPIRTRKKVFHETESQLAVLDGNASDMAESSIWRRGSFLTKKNRKNYLFHYSGYSTLGDHNVFIVEFEPRNKRGDTFGKIYIDEETLGILKLEYFPDLSKTYWKEVSWTEEYYLRNGVYELFRVSYDGKWEEPEKEYHYEAFLLINEIKSAEEMPDVKGLLNSKHTFYHAAEDDFSDAFWSGYNYMKLDIELLSEINDQGAVGNASF